MSKRLIRALSALICVGLLASPAYPAGAEEKAPTVSDEAVTEVLHLLEAIHPAGLGEGELAEAAIQGMLEALNDPYTRYYPQAEVSKLIRAIEGRGSGLGLHLRQPADGKWYVAPYPGSPAEAAEIRRGDLLETVNGEAAGPGGAIALLDKALGEEPEGTAVTLTLRRENEVYRVEVKKQDFQLPVVTVQSFSGNRVGYIRVFTFSEKARQELKAAVEKLKLEGAETLILDLRDNPGGSLEAMRGMAGLFVGEETVMTGRYAGGKEEIVRGGEKQLWDKPLVLLVNGRTASASEMLAGALQDYGARVIGTPSFGKGVGQQVLPLLNGGTLSVTDREFYTPKGRKLHKAGVKPDLEAPGELVPLLMSLRELGHEATRLRFVNGFWELEGVPVEDSVPPLWKEDKVYLPIRIMAALIGGDVEWREADFEAAVQTPGRTKKFGTETGLWVREGTGLVDVALFAEAFPSLQWKSEQNGLIVELNLSKE